MGRQAGAGPAPLTVCLFEYNPLAARHLQQVLRCDPTLQLLAREQEDVLKSKRGAKVQAAVVVLDQGALPTTLSNFLRVVRVRFPEAKIIVVGEPQSRQELFRLLFLGIQGFVPYQEVEEHLAAAVRTVAQGHLWVAPEVLEQYVRYSTQLSRAKAPRSGILTRRERHIIELVQRRLSNKEIGSILNISESTVKFHLSNIFAKLGVRDRQSVVEIVTARHPPEWLPGKSS